MSLLKNNVALGILAVFVFIVMQAVFAHYVANITADKIDNKFIILETPNVSHQKVKDGKPAYRVFKLESSTSRWFSAKYYTSGGTFINKEMYKWNPIFKQMDYGKKKLRTSNDVIAWAQYHAEHPAWFCFSEKREDL